MPWWHTRSGVHTVQARAGITAFCHESSSGCWRWRVELPC